jgi:methionyl-tRNA formyltransferase
MENPNAKQLNIAFFGTPDFASHQLKHLHAEGFNIVVVVTTPDRKQGRGKKLKACAVKEQALELQIPILEPQNLKSPEFLSALATYNIDLQIIVAFRMLPEVVWSKPKYGTINLHGSYLPNYRGAAPINWAIINNESYTGVSTFVLKHEIDSGAVLLREKHPISPTDTFGSMYYKLMEAGAPLLVKSIEAYINNGLQPTEQHQLENKGFISQKAPKLNSETGKIEWNSTSLAVFKLVKGLSPIPCAFTMVQKGDEKQLKLKIIDAELSETKTTQTPGQITTTSDKRILIQCQDSAILVKRLQLEGKKAMDAKDFLNGIDLSQYNIGK